MAALNEFFPLRLSFNPGRCAESHIERFLTRRTRRPPILRGGVDGQVPHTEDEIYVITAGRARLAAGDANVELGPGSVIHVPAAEEHKFTDITEDFAALVLFAPAEESRAVSDGQQG